MRYLGLSLVKLSKKENSIMIAWKLIHRSDIQKVEPAPEAWGCIQSLFRSHGESRSSMSAE
jgi:hypothetical protein